MVRIFQTLLISLSISFLAPSAVGGTHPLHVPSPVLTPVVGKKIPESILSKLRSSSERDRQGAVRKLADIGTEEAWDLVLVAMQDIRGRVAEEAQQQLVLAPAPDEVLKKLYGDAGLRSKDEWVAARAAEVFGQVRGPVDANALIRTLSKKHPVKTQACLIALASQQARGGLDWGKKGDKARIKAARSVEKWLSAEPAIASQALLALVVLDPERVPKACEKSAKSKEPLMRSAALLASFRINDPGTMTLASRLVDDEDCGVRGVAQRTLRKIGSKQALLVLIGRMDVELRRKLILELVPRLQEMTGFKGARSSKVWRKFANDLPDEWQAEGTKEQERSYGKKEESQASSVANTPGLPTYSDRIVYLMDFSGSIWNMRPNGKTRKQMLDPLLHKTLDALKEGTKFNLVPYADVVEPWQAASIDSKPSKIKAAHKFIDQIQLRGTGDFYLAVQWALQDPLVDTICVLTDGAPSGGRRWELGAMVERLIAEGELRPIRFDTVLVDAPGGLKRHWERLAGETGGTVQAIDLGE